MKDIFMFTTNYKRLQEMCNGLKRKSHGLEIAKVVAPAGYGKSTAAERLVTVDQDVAYVLYDNLLTHIGLVKEIAFVLGGVRPSRTEHCRDLIMSELARHRRIVIVDDADKMTIKHFDMLRSFIHDKCHVPVVLVGEESLTEKVEKERRLVSRISYSLVFEPVAQGEIVSFYKQALDLTITNKQAARLVHASKGDFRIVVNHALDVEDRMETSGLKELTDDLLNEVLGNGSNNGK